LHTEIGNANQSTLFPQFFPQKKQERDCSRGKKKMEAVPEELKGVCI